MMSFTGPSTESKKKNWVEANETKHSYTFKSKMHSVPFETELSSSSNYLCRYGSGSGPIWLDDVGCFGSESCLLSCSNRGIGVEDCSHSEDVAISCSGIQFSSTDCSFINTALSSKFTSCRDGQYRRAD